MLQTRANVRLKKRKKIFQKEDAALYLMALPTLIYLLIFCYVPMGGLVMAFQDLNITKGIFRSPYVGLKNFEFLFRTTDAWVITRNTVCYNLIFIVVNLIISISLALMLSSLRSGGYAKTMQTIYMMPYFLSYAVVAIVANAFLDRDNGLVNSILRLMGEPGKTNWYHQLRIWPPLSVFVNAWKNVGYQTVLYLAVISGISVDYYEAAVLDGATKFQQACYITLPHLRYIVGISLILSMSSIFRGDFGLFYNVPMNSGKIYPVTDVIDTYIYRSLTYLNNVGMSTAAGLYQSVVGFVLVLVVNKIVNRIDPDSAMF
ncbi:MAG TPA: ABC transporter permease subunit [Clostridiales bacterium]|nr:ABC transporter permease subunit [Clostridiales bacterium]